MVFFVMQLQPVFSIVIARISYDAMDMVGCALITPDTPFADIFYQDGGAVDTVIVAL